MLREPPSWFVVPVDLPVFSSFGRLHQLPVMAENEILIGVPELDR